MTGPELKQLRHDLGDAIGRRLSIADMAKLCGLAVKNGSDTIRKWEAGQGPSGPVAALVSILAWSSERHAIPDFGYRLDEYDCIRAIRAAMRSEILCRLS